MARDSYQLTIPVFQVSLSFSDEIQALHGMREDDARTVRLRKETLCNIGGNKA